jgi:hypothetical protein
VNEAHLGEQNAYEFDKSTGMWVIKRNNAHIVDNVYRDDSEKRLVRAIQAAHGLVEESEFEEDNEVEEIILNTSNRDGSESTHSSLHASKVLLLNTNNVDKLNGNITTDVDYNDPVPTHRFNIYCTVYILWRGSLVCVQETLMIWMFLSEEYGGLGLAPYVAGVVIFMSTLMLIGVKVIWQQRYTGADLFPLKGMCLTILGMQLPVLLLLIAMAFSFDRLGQGFSKILITFMSMSVTLGCELMAFYGSKIIANMRPERVRWFYNFIYIFEGIGAVLGIFSLKYYIWLPFAVCAGFCLLLPMISLCAICKSKSHGNSSTSTSI